MTTVKITRNGSAIIDTLPVEKFTNAIRRGNITDNIIIINDIPYLYSSVEFVLSGGSQLILAGSISFNDLNVMPGQNEVTKNFGFVKPFGKRVINHYSRIKIPFAGSGDAPLPAFALVLSQVASYDSLNPMPNIAGFSLSYPTVGGAVSASNSNLAGGVRGYLSMVDVIPAPNMYTAGQIEFYLEVVDIPASILPPPILS